MLKSYAKSRNDFNNEILSEWRNETFGWLIIIRMQESNLTERFNFHLRYSHLSPLEWVTCSLITGKEVEEDSVVRVSRRNGESRRDGDVHSSRFRFSFIVFHIRSGV